jgi:hypothetical protein
MSYSVIQIHLDGTIKRKPAFPESYKLAFKGEKPPNLEAFGFETVPDTQQVM